MGEPRLGDTYTWQPEWAVSFREDSLERVKERPVVTGRVCYINAAHRYFTVAYQLDGYRLKESFKF